MLNSSTSSSGVSEGEQILLPSEAGAPLVEEEEDKTSSYSKFKTRNEIDPNELFFQKHLAPSCPALLPTDTLLLLGTVQSVFESNLIVYPDPGASITSTLDGPPVFDLDCIVATQQMQPVGFIDDVFGPVGKPLYSVRLFPPSPMIVEKEVPLEGAGEGIDSFAALREEMRLK